MRPSPRRATFPAQSSRPPIPRQIGAVHMT